MGEVVKKTELFCDILRLHASCYNFLVGREKRFRGWKGRLHMCLESGKMQQCREIDGHGSTEEKNTNDPICLFNAKFVPFLKKATLPWVF